MKELVDLKSVKEVLEKHGYKLNDTRLSPTAELVPINPEDFYTYDTALKINGIITDLTNKSGNSWYYNIYVDNFNFIVNKLVLDFLDTCNIKTFSCPEIDLSEYWMGYLADKHPKYLTCALNELTKKDHTLRDKYMDYYSKEPCDPLAKKLRLMIYKDSVKTIEKKLDILNNIANKKSMS